MEEPPKEPAGKNPTSNPTEEPAIAHKKPTQQPHIKPAEEKLTEEPPSKPCEKPPKPVEESGQKLSEAHETTSAAGSATTEAPQTDEEDLAPLSSDPYAIDLESSGDVEMWDADGPAPSSPATRKSRSLQVDPSQDAQVWRSKSSLETLATSPSPTPDDEMDGEPFESESEMVARLAIRGYMRWGLCFPIFFPKLRLMRI